MRGSTRYLVGVGTLALIATVSGQAFAQQAPTADQQPPAPARPANPNAISQTPAPDPTVPARPAEPAAEAAAAGIAPDEDIVVTGTSIRGIGAPASQSVQFNREDILKSGASTSTEIARTLPQVVNIGADESRRGGTQDAAANRTRTSGINLRGLSSEATLLLLNGRRLAPNGTIKALADPSMIPAIALERLEIVPDGASAIYGADAVAGVVNIITRRPFNGAEVALRYGHADGGLHQMQGSALASHKWDSGGVLLAYDYNYRSNLRADERSFTSADLRPIGGTDQRSTLAAPGNVLISGVRYPIPNGTGRGLTGAQLVAGTPNYFDQGRWGDILPEQERHSLFLTAYQKLTDRLTLTYEGFYSRRTFEEQVIPASSTLSVPATNPYFVRPAAVAATGIPLCASTVGAPAGTRCESVEYRFLDADGDATWSGHDIGWQHSLGLRYDLGGRWQFNGYVDFNKNRGRALTADLLNTVYLPLALADTNPATAFNPFGNGDTANNNPETLRRIKGVRDSYTRNKGRDYVAKIDGPVFALPGGDVRVAVGAEYHENDLNYTIFSSLKNVANDLILDRARAKSRNNKAVFGELYVPLFDSGNATAGFQSLSLQIAGRYEDYSDFGDTFNPKVGATWVPVEGLKVRGSWGTSFRAPSLIDSSDAIFNIFIQNLVDGGVTKRGIFLNGGNNNLSPEKATTWSVGADFKPAFVPGFSAAVTYYNIRYKNVIDALGAATILGNSALYGNYVVRNPSTTQVEALLASPNLESVREPAANILLIVDGRRYNIGRLNQDGIDVQVTQQIETGAGTFAVGAFLTQILNSERSSAPGVPFQNALNLINFPVDTRIRGSVSWNKGGASANLFWNHVGDYINNLITPVARVKAYNTFDGSIGYKFSDDGNFKGLRLTLSAQNLFDRDPPNVINGTQAWDSQNASPIGRFVALDVRKAF